MTMVQTEKRKILECLRCHWIWIPTGDSKPKTCPSCCSPYYDKPYATTKYGKAWAPHKRRKEGEVTPEVMERRRLFKTLYGPDSTEVEFSIHYCNRCGHKWMPKLGKKPRTCPNCGSMYYDRPYKIGPTRLRKHKPTPALREFMEVKKGREAELKQLQDKMQKAVKGIKIGLPRPKNLPRGRHPRGFGEKLRTIANRPYMQELLKALKPIFVDAKPARKEIVRLLPDKLTPLEKSWLSKQLVY